MAKMVRWLVKALILGAVFIACMVGLHLLGWNVGERRATTWLVAVPVGLALLLLNLLWTDKRARVQHLLETKQDWEAAELLQRMAGRGDVWSLAHYQFLDDLCRRRRPRSERVCRKKLGLLPRQE